MKHKKDDLRPEYPPDLIKSGARGKYAKRYRERRCGISAEDTR